MKMRSTIAIIALFLAPFMAFASPVDGTLAANTNTNAPADRPEEECRREAELHFHRHEDRCDRKLLADSLAATV
jgi:hypothetical protein